MIQPDFSRIKRSTILFVTGAVLAAAAAVIFALSYFTGPVFYLDQHKYKQAGAQGNVSSYRSFSGPDIEVHADGSGRKVIVGHEEYAVRKLEGARLPSYGTSYEVRYPDGNVFTVTDRNGQLWSYDENGELFVQIIAYSNGKRMLREGDVLYAPGELVAAAYPEYHTGQGNPVLFVFSVLMLIYGWCVYRYQAFQNFIFKISLYGIWVKEAEPGDFYYFMCKMGGAATMILSVFCFFASM